MVTLMCNTCYHLLTSTKNCKTGPFTSQMGRKRLGNALEYVNRSYKVCKTAFLTFLSIAVEPFLNHNT